MGWLGSRESTKNYYVAKSGRRTHDVALFVLNFAHALAERYRTEPLLVVMHVVGQRCLSDRCAGRERPCSLYRLNRRLERS